MGSFTTFIIAVLNSKSISPHEYKDEDMDVEAAAINTLFWPIIAPALIGLYLDKIYHRKETQIDMIDYNPLLCLDFYKVTHAQQYPKGLTKLVSYLTPRMSRLPDIKRLPMVGLQPFIKDYLIDAFNRHFFLRNFDEVYSEYTDFLNITISTNGVGYDRLKALHDLGYLPIEIRALPEGIRSNITVPQIEISNTHPNFVWLVNSLETMLSTSLWHTQVSTEVGYQYRQIVNEFAEKTCDDNVVRARLLGDFSMRGQESVESATKSSGAFLFSFLNTATVPALRWLKKHYDGYCIHFDPANYKNTVGFGAISTEHSVMCSNFAVDGDEINIIRRLLTEIYPNQSFSMVSDSYDYWNLVNNILPQLKDEIINHNGCLSIRGDSGDPAEIVTQTVFKLWDIFGGTINSKGYKVLDPHIKALYGDSITPQLCRKIYEILASNGFAINNVTLGIGSFSMQCLEDIDADTQEKTYLPYTRDTFGIAIKATYAEDKDGKPVMIFKNPKTDTAKFKKSQRGCCRVFKTEDGYSYEDGLTWDEAQNGNELKSVFKDGVFVRRYNLAAVRNNLHGGDF